MVEVMDESSITLFERPGRAWKYARPHDEGIDRFPILLLQTVRVRGLLERELRTALAKGWDLTLTHETAATGKKQVLVTVAAKSGWPENNCAKEDWAEVQKFVTTPVSTAVRHNYGGLQVIHLGEPFQMTGTHHGWFIPYEIKLKNGYVKKWNLAMYKHRVAKRYIEDGGI